MTRLPRPISALLILFAIVPLIAACSTQRAQTDSQRTGYDDILEVAPYQSAFVIPVDVGNQSEQVQFDSIDYLESKKVAAKRVTITKTNLGGAYYPNVYVYLVDRTPVAREWTSDAGTGTDAGDQSLCTESIESINVCFQLTVAAGVEDKNAATYLYFYPSAVLQNQNVGGVYTNTPLERVIDNQVRNFVLAELTKEAKGLPLTDILGKTNEIIARVQKLSIDEFAKQGITIHYVGMGGELELSPEIQAIINELYVAKMNQEVARLNATTTAINADAQRYALEQKGQGDAAALLALQNAVGGPENLIRMADTLEAYRWDGSKLTVMLNESMPAAIPLPLPTEPAPTEAPPTPAT